MSTFLERLKTEFNEVNDRFLKLEQYIDTNEHFRTISTANQDLLVKQKNAMKEYIIILSIRIELNDK